MRPARMALLVALLPLAAGCILPSPGGLPAQEGPSGPWSATGPLLGVRFGAPDAEGRVDAFAVHAGGSAIRFRYLPTDSADVLLPGDAGEADDVVRILFTWEGGNRNRTAGGIVESLSPGSVPEEQAEALRVALREAWRNPCPACEGNVETFLRFEGRERPEVARTRGGPDDGLDPLRAAFEAAGLRFQPGQVLLRPPSPGRAEPSCVDVHVLPERAVVAPGEPVRVDVRLENCGGREALSRDACSLFLTVKPLQSEGGMMLPGDAPAPATGTFPRCLDEGSRMGPVLAPGGNATFRFTWDGRFVDVCQRLSEGPPCQDERAAPPAAYSLVAVYLGAAARHAGDAYFLVVPPAPRPVPVVLVSENYTKSRVSVELPARGEGCDAFERTREPLSFTALEAENASAAAVVLREFPQGGYGAFPPATAALPPDGSVVLRSAFDPARVLLTLRHENGTVTLDGEPLAETPRRVEAAFETRHEGETFQVTESLDVRLAGEAYVFGPTGRRSC